MPIHLVNPFKNYMMKIKQHKSFAGEMAYHGHRVKLFDNNIDALNSAHERIEEDKKQLREEGLLSHRNFIVSSSLAFIKATIHNYWEGD